MFKQLLIVNTELVNPVYLTYTINSDVFYTGLNLVIFHTVVKSSWQMSHENEGDEVF